MKQKPMSIHEFAKGDKITRIQPSKPIAKIGDEEIVDRNYIGTPFIFVGIANGCIYLRRIMDSHMNEMMNSFLTMFGDLPNENPLKNIELSLYEDGWSHYIDPMTLEGGKKPTNSLYSLKNLRKKLGIALNKEDYLEVDKIQKQIKRLKK